MLKRGGSWWIPVGSFGLAVLLSLVAGTVQNAQGRQVGAQTEKCCKLKGKTLVSNATTFNFVMKDIKYEYVSSVAVNKVTATGRLVVGDIIVKIQGKKDRTLNNFDFTCKPVLEDNPGKTDNCKDFVERTISGSISCAELDIESAAFIFAQKKWKEETVEDANLAASSKVSTIVDLLLKCTGVALPQSAHTILGVLQLDANGSAPDTTQPK